MKMMRKILFCLFSAWGLSSTANADEAIIHFSPSWVDGVATENNEQYIKEVNTTSDVDWFKYTSGKTYTFKAIVPKGHDVTKWSYAAYASATVIAARTAGGFQNEKVTSPVDTFVWSSIPAGGQSLAVHFDWLKYTISFEGNGLTSGSSTAQAGLAYNQSVALAANPYQKTGHQFIGWVVKGTSSPTYGDGQLVTGESFDGLAYTNKSVTLVAQWSANAYDVSYDANGGAFADSSLVKTKKIVFGQVYGEPLGVPSRAGWSFQSWTNHLGQTVNPSTILTMPSDHVLYASWKALGPYSVNAVQCSDEPGAGGVVLGTGSYAWGASCYLQATESTGSRFVGWTRNATGSEIESTASVYPITVTNDVTYYAHFALKEFTVTFVYKNANGDTISTNEVVKYGQDAEPPTLPARAHYRFLYWDKSYQSVKGDLTVNALYESTALTVHFDANGGNGKMADRPADQGQEFEVPACEFTNGNRSFTGWTGSDGKTYQPGQMMTEFNGCVQDVFTLTAQWAETYLVHFDGNGATTGEMTNLAIEVGETYALPSNRFARTGYAFSGWATNETTRLAKTVVYADGAEVRDMVGLGESITLSAIWTANPYRVRFYPNGGEGKPFEQSLSYDAVGTLPGAGAFKRTGYELVGWLEDPTNAWAYALGESVSNLTEVAHAVVPFFAKWVCVEEDPGVLSRAADCDSNRTDRVAVKLTTTNMVGCVVRENDDPLNSGNSQYLALSSNTKTTLTLAANDLSGTGTLSFYYKVSIDQTPLLGARSAFKFMTEYGGIQTKTNVTEWTRYSQRFNMDEKDPSWILEVNNAYGNDLLCIDNIAWLPDERERATVGVTFRLNDGTAAPLDILSNATYAVGEAIGALPTTARPDAGFLGWATLPSGGTMIDPTWEIPSADTQLYAQWQSQSDVPVAIPDLVYTGTLQTGVVATAGVLLTDNAKTEAGSYEAVATLLPGCTWRDGSTHSTNIAWSIAKATYDMSGVSFTNATYVVDGLPKSLAITGEMPDGVTVIYEGNGKTAVGTYTVTAKFSGDETNYEPIADLTATLKIEARAKTPVDAPVAIKGLVYNGSVQTGVVAVAGFELSVNVATNAGQYVAIATPAEGFCWTGGDTNAVEIGWEIAKAVYDVSGISFTNATYLADGTAKSLVITGELPDGVMVEYVGNGQTAPGTYTVTAKFSGDAENHEAIADKTATLTIYQLVYDMSGVSFPSVSYAWDGTEKSLAVSGELPEGVTVEYVGNGQTAPGTYTVTAVFSGDAIGHAAIPDMTATLKIVMPDQLADSFPTGIKGFAYPTVSIATVWPDAAAHPGDWKISGWPSGIKFAKSNVYGTPKKVGSFTISAVRKSTGKTYTATFAVRDPLPSELPSCEIDFGGTPVDPATKAVRLYAGVKYSWPLEATAGAKVTASKLPTGMKLVKQKTAAGYAYSVAGVPKKAKQFTTTFKVKAGGLTGTPAVTFDVLPLPSWAQGQFDGGSDAGLLTLKITSAGKLNGKYQEAGIKSKLTAASYDSYDESTGVYSVSATFSGGSAGKVTRVFRVSRDEVSGYFTDGSLTARQNLWKSDWKSVAALCAKAPSTSLETAGGLVTLKPGAKGVIKATFERGGKKAKCSSVLLPATLPAADGFLADVCLDFSPKSIPDGFATVLRLRWTGETFVAADE